MQRIAQPVAATLLALGLSLGGCTPVTPTRSDLVEVIQQHEMEIDRLQRKNDVLINQINELRNENTANPE